MTSPSTPLTHPEAPTREIADWIASTPEVGEEALRWARHCLLDWLAVTLAGAREELVDILVAEALADDGQGSAPLVGRDERLSPSWALLVNGTAGHALDYDDVNTAMRGHPTVAVMPAVLQSGARDGRSLDEVLRAFAVGYEICCLVGEMTGDAHYDRGWHATATVGTFGAAAGMAALHGFYVLLFMSASVTVAVILSHSVSPPLASLLTHYTLHTHINHS